MGRQGEKNQACPAVQHPTTKGKWTFIGDLNQGTLRFSQFMDAPAQFSHNEGLYLGMCDVTDVLEENSTKKKL